MKKVYPSKKAKRRAEMIEREKKRHFLDEREERAARAAEKYGFDAGIREFTKEYTK